MIQQRLETLESRFARQRLEIGILGIADELQAVPGEMFKKAGERKAGPVEHRLDDLALKISRSGEQFQAEFLPAGLKEVGHGENDSGVIAAGRKLFHSSPPQFLAEAARCLRTVPLRALTRIRRS